MTLRSRPPRRRVGSTLLAGLAVGLAASSAPALADPAPPPTPVARLAPQPGLTVVVDESWSEDARATLTAWLSPASPEMRAFGDVVGSPAEPVEVTVVHDPTLDRPGRADPVAHVIWLRNPLRNVVVHELAHAVRSRWTLSDTWEEGLAMAAEITVMSRLADEGDVEARSYTGLHHDTPVHWYYENDNVPAVAPTGGWLQGGLDGLRNLRYWQAGYAVGKLVLEDPRFIRDLDALLAVRFPDGRPPDDQVAAMAAAVRPQVEGQPTAAWLARQRIFDQPAVGPCRLMQQLGQFIVHFSCGQSGGEGAQVGATVTYRAYDATERLLWTGSARTDQNGMVRLPPEVGAYRGRLRLVASATARGRLVPTTSTGYRQAGQPRGLFGIVTSGTTGTVTFRSPTAAFAEISVPVTDGAFEAPSLAAVAGTIEVGYTDGARTVSRMVTKDAAPYSLVIAR